MALWQSTTDYLVQQFEQNAQLGRLAFTDVLQMLWKEKHAQSTT